jgi:phage-related protein
VRELVYHDEPGKPSPREYIHNTRPTERANINLRLEFLRDLDIKDWPRTWVKKVEGKLWELKSGPHRIFYFLDANKIIVVHAIRKKRRKLMRGDIELGLRRIDDYFRKLNLDNKA